MDKEKRIKTELNKLKKIYKDLSEEQQKANSELIQNAAFMVVTLQDLQSEINENGSVEEYRNGENQYGRKKSAAVEVYNTTIKNYTQIMKILNEMLPKEKPKTSALAAFLNND